MPISSIPTGIVSSKKQCRDDCVFSKWSKFLPTGQRMPPNNFSLEQLDQFNLEDNKISTNNEVDMKPPQETGLTASVLAGADTEQHKSPVSSAQDDNLTPLLPPPPPKPSTFQQPPIELAPIDFNQPVEFPQTSTVQCPHCSNFITIQSLLPVPDNHAGVDCCAAMTSARDPRSQFVIFPCNEEQSINHRSPQGQYQNMMQFPHFRTAQSSCHRHLTQVPSLSCHKLISHNLPPSTRSVIKNLSALSTCSSEAFLYQEQCTQQKNKCQRKNANRRKDIFDECSNQTEPTSDFDTKIKENSGMFLDCLRRLTLISQKLLDHFESSMSKKNITKNTIAQSSPRNIRRSNSEVQYNQQQNVRLEPIRVTVPIKLNFSN